MQITRAISGLGLLAAAALGACEARFPDEQRFSRFVIRISERSDLVERNFAVPGSAVVEFCNLHLGPQALRDGCARKDPALEGVRGFRVLMLEQPNWRWSRLKERPADASPPRADPLVPVMTLPSGVGGDVNDHEWYPLSRLKNGQEPPAVYSTSVGWPLVGCDLQAPHRAFCTAGFIIDNVFVEASWSNRGGMPSQAEVWRIASGLDAKLRTFITPAVLAEPTS